MSAFVGHLVTGALMFLIGVWHMFNHIRQSTRRPGSSYAAPIWFPAPLGVLRHLELIAILVITVVSILMELIGGQRKHHPFDDDGTIPSGHLPNLEHASISLAYLVYAAATVHMDRARTPMRDAVSRLAFAAALAQQLLVFHFHSADHDGLFGQYHLLMQVATAVTLAATLLEAIVPCCAQSFAVSLVRMASFAFQGVWFDVIGVMLWTPGLMPKGCFHRVEDDDRHVFACRTDEALRRAKALVNLQFSWYLTCTVVFVIVFYLRVSKVYGEEQRYVPLMKVSGGDVDGDSDGQFGIGEEKDDLEASKHGYGNVVGSM